MSTNHWHLPMLTISPVQQGRYNYSANVLLALTEFLGLKHYDILGVVQYEARDIELEHDPIGAGCLRLVHKFALFLASVFSYVSYSYIERTTNHAALPRILL